MRAKNLLVLFLILSLVGCASAQQKIVKARQKDPRYQYNLGLVYLNQGNLDPKNIDEAIKYFVKCLALDTHYYLAWNAIGLAQSLKGNLDESAKAYQKCLELNSDFSEAHNNLGTIYQEQNLTDKAESEFKKAAADPTFQTRGLAYYNLARLYTAQNRNGEALENVDKAIQNKSRFHMALNLKGLILEKQNKLEEAVGAYEQAVKLVPDDVHYNYNLGVAYFKTEEFAKAKEIFLKISPRASEAEMKDNIAKFLKIINERGNHAP
jgi:Tfp pilus assembly protein PilF